MVLEPSLVGLFPFVIGRLVENPTAEALGHKILVYKVMRSFVAVVVALSVAQVFLHGGYRIAQGFRHGGLLTGLTNRLQGGLDGQVSGIAFGT